MFFSRKIIEFYNQIVVSVKMDIIKMIKGNALYAIAHVIHVMDLMPQIVCHAI
jgi:hypothetical protein